MLEHPNKTCLSAQLALRKNLLLLFIMCRLLICQTIFYYISLLPAYAQSSVPENQQIFDEYWPYGKRSKNIWEKAFGPTSGSVMFMINDRPILFKRNKREMPVNHLLEYFNGDILSIAGVHDTSKSEVLSELYLYHAVSVAKTHAEEEPWDVVESLVNLAALYFQHNKYAQSESCLEEAIRRAQLVKGAKHPDIADLKNYLAMVYRAQQKYGLAEVMYRSSLEIKQQSFGSRHPEVATCYYNLAMLYSDAGKKEDADMLLKAQKLLGDRVFLNTSLTPRPRPKATSLTTRSGYISEVPSMIAFAESIIIKHPPEPIYPGDEPPTADPALATISGEWTIPADKVTLTDIRHPNNPSSASQGLGGSGSLNTDQASPVQYIPIYLLPANHQQMVEALVSTYAQQNKLNIEEFGKKWPKSLTDALTLKKFVDNAIANRAIKTVYTDKNGMFQFENLEPASYLLCASIATETGIYSWCLPQKQAQAGKDIKAIFDQGNITKNLWLKPEPETKDSK